DEEDCGTSERRGHWLWGGIQCSCLWWHCHRIVFKVRVGRLTGKYWRAIVPYWHPARNRPNEVVGGSRVRPPSSESPRTESCRAHLRHRTPKDGCNPEPR